MNTSRWVGQALQTTSDDTIEPVEAYRMVLASHRYSGWTDRTRFEPRSTVGWSTSRCCWRRPDMRAPPRGSIAKGDSRYVPRFGRRPSRRMPSRLGRSGRPRRSNALVRQLERMARRARLRPGPCRGGHI